MGVKWMYDSLLKAWWSCDGDQEVRQRSSECEVEVRWRFEEVGWTLGGGEVVLTYVPAH